MVPYEARDAVHCRDCDSPLTRVWRKAPGVRGSGDTLSKDELLSARNPLIRGAKAQKIEPFKGTTRSEYNRWLAKNNISPVSSGEVKSRNTEVNSGPTPQQQARREKLAAVTAEAREKIRQGYQAPIDENIKVTFKE